MQKDYSVDWLAIVRRLGSPIKVTCSIVEACQSQGNPDEMREKGRLTAGIDCGAGLRDLNSNQSSSSKKVSGTAAIFKSRRRLGGLMIPSMM